MKPHFALFVCLLSVSSYASGGGGGGGLTFPNPLPTRAPAADVILRESFGAGPDNARPTGGKGTMKPVYASFSLGGFWNEWPSGKAMQWSAADPDANHIGWRWAGASLNPNQTLPSPVDQEPFNGVVMSWWFDGIVGNPTALVPFTAPATPYDLTADIYPAVLAGSQLSVGFTAGGALSDNLSSVGQYYLSLRQDLPLQGFTATYELRAGGSTGPVLATGGTMLLGFNTVKLHVDPLAGTVSASLNGTFIGSFPLTVAPRSIALEGQGYVDNLVVRLAP